MDNLPKHAVALFNKVGYCYLYMIDASEMGKRGAAATNKILTTEKRRKAAKKGWRLRKQMLKAKEEPAKVVAVSLGKKK